ncbi:hypothetical protein G9A89_002403 [Geosiphon pyriformis]|nr:hypothetical protein G9A89_002403 [Geosiphon pyriformis]
MSPDREVVNLRQELENIEQVNVTLREQLECFQNDNNTLTDENSFMRKKVTSLQADIANQHNGIARLEAELYQQSQEVERLKKENSTWTKNKREAERKLKEETRAFEKERQTWHERESELADHLKALQDTIGVLAQQNIESQKKHSHSSSNEGSTPPESPTTSLHNAAREIKIAQRTIKEQDRLIYQLKTEIERAKTATTDTINLNKGLSLKINLLENELEQVKRMKRSLEDVNEGLQLLLHEKTMLNPHPQDSIAVPKKSPGEQKESPTDDTFKEKDMSLKSIKREKKARPKSIVTDLAAELQRASADNITPLGESVQKESDQVVDFEKMQEEIKSLKDANNVLRNYIQKILDRIMEADGFEQLLSTDWSKRAPPSNPSTPTATTFAHVRSQSKSNNITTTTTTKTPEINKESAASKKLERRKTLSGPFRGSIGDKLGHLKIPSSPPTSPKSTGETGDQLSPLPVSPAHSREPSISEEVTSSPRSSLSVEPPKRAQRRNSSSDGNPRKRWSLWWTAQGKQQPGIKKEDPYMRPIILVQEKEMAKE